MNLLSKKLSLIVVSSALVLAGCSKKPRRPAPSDTALGMGGAAGSGLEATPTGDLGSGLTDPSAANLQARPPGVLEDENTIRGLLQPVYFDYDNSAIRPAERLKLEEAQKYLQANPQYRLLLEGHCDWRGTAEYNLGLGDRRAGASRQYLQSLGVDAAKLETLSKGDLDAVENANDDQMSKDRRVELVILKK